MKIKTFPRGIHPDDRKTATRDKAIEEAPLPKSVVLPLQQSAGVPSKPIVAPRDHVLAGQKIAEAGGYISSPLHSPVAGTVKAVEPRPHHSGLKVLSIVIEPDEEQEYAVTKKGPAEPSAEYIREAVREAGIVGLGGAAFPTGVKVSPPPEMNIDTVIINGCECEPYLTVDYRTMIEEPDKIVDGLGLLMAAVGAKNGIVGIEDNKEDAIRSVFEVAGPSGYKIAVLETKYPQGAEKQQIEAVLGRQVPSGALPGHVGVLVQNVGTAAAVSAAVREGIPLTKRPVTLAGGGIREPKNLRTVIGAPISGLIEFCGGAADDTAKVIMGGPMMGIALSSTEVPVVKATSGVIAMIDEELDTAESRHCIKCGRCVQACPMGLMPNMLSVMSEAGIWEEMGEEHVFDCVECGCCSFVCPAKRPMVQQMRLGKFQLSKDKK